MISKELSLWIAQSESWQTFIDFKLPEDSIARYIFLKRYDDFYISLFGQVYEILDRQDNDPKDILAIAKGLEIYSLNNKRENFNGVSESNNILFAAGLYYLAEYSASAYILANLYRAYPYQLDIDKFIIQFLSRKPQKDNVYSRMFIQYLNSGNRILLEGLRNLLRNRKEITFKSSSYLFSSYFLAERLIARFLDNNIWVALLEKNNRSYWKDYVDRSIAKRFPVWDFFPSQKIALASGLLDSFNSISLQTPTSSGKTAICELLVYNEFKQNPNVKILYLAPFRALAAELKSSFGRNLSRLGISSKTIYGGNIPSLAEKELIQNVTLLISTPEKFMAIENAISNFLSSFHLIICDEGHLLDDSNRGLSYELLLARLKGQKDVQRRFVFISAIIPNIDRINSWLGGNAQSVVRSTYRSTEIEYGFLTKTGDSKNYHLEVNPFKQIPQKFILNKFLTESDFIYQGKRKPRVHPFDSNIAKSVAVALKSLNSGSVALFSPTKGGGTGVSALAREMINQINIGLPLPRPIDFVFADSDIVGNLKEYFTVIFGANYLLTMLIEYGALYHHGDLPQYVREVIEDAIRAEKVKMIICTNTLAEGVNLPIRTIVINSAQRFDIARKRLEPLNLRDVKNLVGRAGRAGKETKGLVIVVNPNDFSILEDIIKDQNIEEVNGHLFFIISRISTIIIEKQLVLTNEILDIQDESFMELLDSIDISLIDLLGEEITVEELKGAIQSLVDSTFAKFQSNADEANTLQTLADLRGEKLRPLIESGEFRILKQSGTTLRNYTELQSLIDFEKGIWQTLDDPTEEEWLNMIVDDIAAKLPTLQYQLEVFNKANKVEITFELLKNVIKMWINGSWFQEISEYLNTEVDVVLRFVNSFIGYHIQNLTASVIRNVELRYVDLKLPISTVVLNFPQNLTYGLKKAIELSLVEIGFSDRIAISIIASYLDLIDHQFDSLSGLKVFLREQAAEILAIIRPSIPVISYNRTEESFSYLSILNMN